jgi:hypothetical protein
VENVFDGSADGAEDLENKAGLLGRQRFGSPLHRQLFLGIIIQVFMEESWQKDELSTIIAGSSNFVI